jgi:hypothetical protein
LPVFWRERAGIRPNIKEKSEGMDNVEVFDSFGIFGDTIRPDDSYLLNARVNIAAGILTRNTTWPEFILTRDGDEITGSLGPELEQDYAGFRPARIRPVRGYSKTMPFLKAF